MELGDRIKDLRIKKNLTQEELAISLKLTRPTLSNWEINRTNPDHAMIAKIANYFNVTTDYLITGSDSSSDITFPHGKMVVYMENDKIVDASQLPNEAKKSLEDYITFLKQKYNL